MSYSIQTGNVKTPNLGLVLSLFDDQEHREYDANWSTLDAQSNVTTQSVNYTAQPTDSLILVNGLSNQGVTLPLGASYVLSAAAAVTASGAVYTGTITGGDNNAFAGQQFTIVGFDLVANNGTFVCVASTATTLTLNNPNSVADTHAAAANTGVPVGKRYTIKNIGTGTPINVFTGNAGEFAGNPQIFSVPGGAAYGGFVTVEWDGSHYWMLGYHQ
jgi:hypothetical protein